MTTESFENMYCSGNIAYHEKNRVLVDIYLNSELASEVIRYKAVAPPDYRGSFTGSALPFPNEEFAFQHSPNVGALKVSRATRRFTITLDMPNSYYAPNGKDLIPPYVDVLYEIKESAAPFVTRIYLTKGRVLNRSLTYHENRTSPLFYNASLPVRTQEQILRDSGFQVDRSTFWGKRPPQ